MQAKFDYHKANDLADALSLIDEHNRPYQGGTDLIVQIRAQNIAPKRLIDVNDLPDLKGIEIRHGFLSIGSATRACEIADHELIQQWAPALAASARTVGGPAIRHKATIGGNIATASPAGDLLNACWGLDAHLRVRSAESTRVLSLREAVRGPGVTALQPNELIERVELPLKKWAFEQFFKIGRRNAMAISVVNGICALDYQDDGWVTDVRISLGAVGTTPLRVESAENILRGSKLDRRLNLRAMSLIQRSVNPISDIRGSADYRRYIAGYSVFRILCKCVEQQGE